MKEISTIFVVDGDQAVRYSLHRLIESIGINVQTYACASDFLEIFDSSQPGCLVLAIHLPGMDGLGLQEKLMEDKIELPIIFIAENGTVEMAVRAMKAGALDFIEKPINEKMLLEQIQYAIEKDINDRKERKERDNIHERLSRLTPRERQIMEYLVKDKTNKEIAAIHGLSYRTIEIHRRRVLRKMQASTLCDLIRKVMLYNDCKLEL